jgi:hypothetical protein
MQPSAAPKFTADGARVECTVSEALGISNAITVSLVRAISGGIITSFHKAI